MFDRLMQWLFPPLGPIVIETYESKGKWYWRLTAGNGEIVCDGSEAYSSRSNCRRAAKRVKRLMTIADVA